MSELPPTAPPPVDPPWLRAVKYLSPFGLGLSAIGGAIYTGDHDLVVKTIGAAGVCALTLIQASK